MNCKKKIRVYFRDKPYETEGGRWPRLEIKPPTPAIGPDGAKEMVESIEFSGSGKNQGCPTRAYCVSGKILEFNQCTRKFYHDWYLRDVPGLGKGESMDKKFFGRGEPTNKGKGKRGKAKTAYKTVKVKKPTVTAKDRKARYKVNLELARSLLALEEEEEKTKEGYVYAFYDKFNPEYIKIGCSCNVKIRYHQAKTWMVQAQVLAKSKEKLTDKWAGEAHFHDLYDKFNTQLITGPGWATEMFHIPNEADREKLREMIYEYKDASTPGSCP